MFMGNCKQTALVVASLVSIANRVSQNRLGCLHYSGDCGHPAST
jgi:hypothetical protein